MCNEYGNRIPYRRYVEEFSHLKLRLSVSGNGPDLSPRDQIHIRDTAPVIVRAGDGVELTEMTWAPRDRNKKPVFNFRSEKRSVAKSIRCLIPASHFVEFTTPTDPGSGILSLAATVQEIPLINNTNPTSRNRIDVDVLDFKLRGRCRERPSKKIAANAVPIRCAETSTNP